MPVATNNYVDRLISPDVLGDAPLSMGDASPRQVRTYMPMPAAACVHRHRQIFPKLVWAMCLFNHTGIGIDFPIFLGNVTHSQNKLRTSMSMPVAACKPQASAYMSLLVWAMCRPEKCHIAKQVMAIYADA
jgi:hypothetical protein